tara:strand:+ start:2434 stop:2808 length:375 start_codon:yes stop_codon:yes gene_type:complete
MKDLSSIKEFVSLILEQDANLESEQIKITCVLIMSKDAHVPDTLTRIRALPSVTVVSQKEPVTRQVAGNTTLEIYVKFLPASTKTYKNLVSVGNLIKSLPDVKIVKILASDGRPVLYKGKPIIL